MADVLPEYEQMEVGSMGDRTDVFSYEELIMLSKGILTMMENTNKAMELTMNHEVNEILSKDLEIYRQLNDKVCGMMAEPIERG